MWNVIKNVFRSLAKNKFAIFGLTFLVFLSFGILTVLGSTTSSIRNSYQEIITKSNLHDFTINELYDYPEINFVPVSYNNADGQYVESYYYSNDNQTLPYFKETKENNNYFRTYQLMYHDDGTNSIYNNFFRNNSQNQSYFNYFYPLFTIESKNSFLEDQAHNPNDPTLPLSISFDNWYMEDYDQYNLYVSKFQSDLSNFYDQEGKTPLIDFLNTDLSDQVNYQKYQSIDIDNSSKNFYKVVTSNPSDQIDKLYLFNDLFDTQSLSWNGFESSDFNPLQDDIIANLIWYVSNNIEWFKKYSQDFIDLPKNNFNPFDVATVLNYHTNQNIGKIDLVLCEKMRLISKGNLSNVIDPIKNIINEISLDSTIPIDYFQLVNSKYFDANQIDNDTKGFQFENVLQDILNTNVLNSMNTYISSYQNQESLYLRNYQYTIKWSTTSSWVLNNWTSKFAVISPSFLQDNHLKPLDEESFTKNESYQKFDQIQKEIFLTNKSQKDIFIEWLNIFKFDDLENWFNELKVLFQSSIVNVGGGTDYFCIGAGITPDFVYPVVSLDHPIVDTTNEAIIFTNNSGYQRIYDGFRQNNTESYVVGKFINNANANKVLDEINDFAKINMAYPSNIKAAYLFNDTHNILNSSAQRIAFIPEFLNGIEWVAYFLTAVILILGLIVSAVVIRRYINQNRVNIGIMRANGLSKTKICFSLLPFALIPAVVGVLAGYVSGIFLQVPTASLFKTYWVLPTNPIFVSPIILLVCILIPLGLFMLISSISTIMLLRSKPTDLMKIGSEYSSNFFARTVKKGFVTFGIITRFRVSIAFQSFWKLFILCFMTAITISSFVFGMTAYGKFDYSLNETAASKNYQYAIDLYSPTVQGGQYFPITSNDYGASGMIQTNEQNNLYIPGRYFNQFQINNRSLSKTYYRSNAQYDGKYLGLDDPLASKPEPPNSNSIVEWSKYLNNSTVWHWAMTDDKDVYHGNIEIPFANDSSASTSDLMYLKNATQTKLLMNYDVGANLFGNSIYTNPWSIAASLMPQNSKNVSDSKTDMVVNQAGRYYDHVLHSNSKTDEESAKTNLVNYFLYNEKPISEDDLEVIHNELLADNSIMPFQINKSNAVSNINSIIRLSISLDPNYVKKVILDIYSNIPNNLEDLSKEREGLFNNDYSITYNQVILDPNNDQTYTYLSGDMKQVFKSSKKVEFFKDAKIYGIDPNTTFLSLTNDSGDPIQKRLVMDKFIQNPNWNEIEVPLIINKYAAKKYNFSVNDVLGIEVSNQSNRLVSNEKKIYKFKIVGICESYEGEEFYTNQQAANAILGLKSALEDDINFPSFNLNQTYLDYDEISSLNQAISNKNTNFNDLNDNLDSLIIDIQKNSELVNRNNSNEVYEAIKLQPYGFNGVFSKASSNQSILNNMMFYSPSGLWPAIDSYLSNDAFKLFQNGLNIQIANLVTGIKDQDITDATKNFLNNPTYDDNGTYQSLLNCTSILQKKLENLFGKTPYYRVISNVTDVNASKKVYENISQTINAIEYIVLITIIFIILIIVLLISIIIIDDSKKMASILKSLGYSDNENALSFLSIYIPVILIGLLLSIPIAILMVTSFQWAIFGGAGLLLNMNIKWWYYLSGIALVCAILSISIAVCYGILKRTRLVDNIK